MRAMHPRALGRVEGHDLEMNKPVTSLLLAVRLRHLCCVSHNAGSSEANLPK